MAQGDYQSFSDPDRGRIEGHVEETEEQHAEEISQNENKTNTIYSMS